MKILTSNLFLFSFEIMLMYLSDFAPKQVK